MNNNYIPREMKCFWCNGHMEIGGPSYLGSGLNSINYFCKDCGGVAIFARDADRLISSFEINFNYKGEKNGRSNHHSYEA